MAAESRSTTINNQGGIVESGELESYAVYHTLSPQDLCDKDHVYE